MVKGADISFLDLWVVLRVKELVNLWILSYLRVC